MKTEGKKRQSDGWHWYLSESTSCNDIVHPLHSETSAQLDCLDMALSRSCESREEEAHAKTVINVSQGINEGGVPVTEKNISEFMR